MEQLGTNRVNKRQEEKARNKMIKGSSVLTTIVSIFHGHNCRSILLGELNLLI